jgi:GT2 family glycosyltransferase
VRAAEVIVSHSGGAGALPALPPDVLVDAAPQRRPPGAARNAGVAKGSAPYVAFLAADCVALPGWVEGRVRRHRAGAQAVASAMASPPHPSAALASHLLQHGTRMAHVRAAPHLRFGLSYSREVLAAYGPFPEDLLAEEDVALNARLLAAGVEPVLAPDVLTAHAYPLDLRALVRDQYRRGRQRQAIRGARRGRVLLAGRALLDAPAGFARAVAPGSPVPRSAAARAVPHVALGALATAAGISRGRAR